MQKEGTAKQLWQKQRDPAPHSCWQPVFTDSDGTWRLRSGTGLTVTSISHPATAWSFPLLIVKMDGLYSVLFKDQKGRVSQRKAKEKEITGLAQQIN